MKYFLVLSFIFFSGCSKMETDSDSSTDNTREKRITGSTDIGFGSSWQLSWEEWMPPGLPRTFITESTLRLATVEFEAFGYEVGEPPESLPCSLTPTSNARILTVTHIVDETPQPIMDNIYKIYFVIPASPHNTYINADVCLALNSIHGPHHELKSTLVHLRFL